MSVFCQGIVYLLLALPAVAQSQAFAKITIKPARSADPRNLRVQVLPNGDLIASAKAPPSVAPDLAATSFCDAVNTVFWA